MIFLSLCATCELKKSKVKKNVVVKPIISSDFNSRCQVDLIDMQARPDEEYKFIMVYQDHLTKFVVLNALKTKTAIEVTQHLIKIFATFGAPRIFHSDNGKEFANKVVAELVSKWPACKIVHGKPRHSQSQGSVERANRDIGDILTIWLRDNNTMHWADALPIVQAMKNQRYHSGIKRSPYEAMFGKKMQLGYGTETPNEQNETDTEDDEEFKNIDGSEWLDINREIGLKLDEEILIGFEDQTENNNEEDFAASSNEIDNLLENVKQEEELNERFFSQQSHREGAHSAQKLQAERMLKSSNKRYAPIDVGTNVRIPIPDVDRSKIDPRNMLGVVTAEDNGFYTVGTKHGTLAQLYSRNQIEPCQSNFLSIDEVPDENISLRAAVGASSVSGTAQGHVHCNCNGKCLNKRCSCQKAGRQCNSRCHPHGQKCENK